VIFESERQRVGLLSQPTVDPQDYWLHKELPWLEKQLWLALAYYHLVLPNARLRQRLDMPETTRGNGFGAGARSRPPWRRV
jgi:hypothetical protein